jgi:protein-tyrosine phosphatase
MLPEPRNPDGYRIALVCLGNICRSPVADVVVNTRIDRAGLAGRVSVESSGTGHWHVGNPMDDRAAATLVGEGYDPTAHRARQFTRELVEEFDLVLAMDRSNLADLRRLGVPEERLRLFRDFDPQPGDGEVPDPYYGGSRGFTDVLAMVERTSIGLVAQLQAKLGSRSGVYARSRRR